MSDQFKAAGIAILRYAYEVCDTLLLDRTELPELFERLRDAIAIGQTPRKHAPTRDARLLPEYLIDRIQVLHREGWTNAAISRALGVTEETASKYSTMDADDHLTRTRRTEAESPSAENSSAPVRDNLWTTHTTHQSIKPS